jgi:hypothetical protein
MPRYSKPVEGVDQLYQPKDLFKYLNDPFDVRVSLLDEPPEVGLWVTLEADDVNRPIGDLLDEFVIGAESQQTEFVREKMLELDEFPHLSDALDRMADIWHRFRAGEADVRLYVNHGPDDISLDDSAYQHMGSAIWSDGSWDYMILDVVLEPGEMTLAGMLGSRKREFTLWMKGLLALYRLDVDSSTEKHLRKRPELEEAREQLFFHNLISKGARDRLEITQQGRRAIGRLLEERDELEVLYDLYRDVVIRPGPEGFTGEFGTLSGADYRVAVYRQEGLDPFRCVFLLVLLSGELDEELTGKKWLDLINDDRFYEKLLAPAVDHATLEQQKLDELIAQGKQYLARTTAMRGRAGYAQGVLERARTIQAFPRPIKGGPAPEAIRPFKKASDAEEPSDELGEPPLTKPLPASKPPELEAAPSATKATPPSETKKRSTRPFKAGLKQGPAARPAFPRPSRDTSDDDDGWL